MKKIQFKKTLTITLAIIGILLLCVSFYFNYQYYTLLQNPQKFADNELQTTLDKVSKLIVLPSDDTPSMATVLDPNALKDQPFFVNAVKDDQVLIFPKSQKAILYRPSTNKIIEVGPINIDNTTQSQNEAPIKTEETLKEDVEQEQ
jgi:hypothetical protein